MKKVILITLVGALPALALAGCGGSDSPNAGGVDSANPSQMTEQQGHDADGHNDEMASQATEQHEHDPGEGHDDGGHDADESAHDSDGHEHEASGTEEAAAEHSHDSGDDTHAAPEEHSHDAQSGSHEHGSPAGTAGNAADVGRTVEIGMNDTMQFTPDSVTVSAGETVKFVIHNNGKIPHEFVIGSMSELLEHAEMMKKMPGMQHAESNMLTLESDAEGEIIWKFGESGSVDFACLIPGHLEAGMKGVVQVE